ncbi:hypothetical protein BC936DRAFT_144142 [Jimgerdemannia flammicorona]|uniref:Uncharacterized protein n=1 Tax=Jimgerdemannia flammicorona TaxID=994334 RepID=A0A433DCX2_9FUNG|nr:hypothetical protein BC936DRAFT_144142 [Jimgerdemannia flammicorona]
MEERLNYNKCIQGMDRKYVINNFKNPIQGVATARLGCRHLSMRSPSFAHPKTLKDHGPKWRAWTNRGATSSGCAGSPKQPTTKLVPED